MAIRRDIDEAIRLKYAIRDALEQYVQHADEGDHFKSFQAVEEVVRLAEKLATNAWDAHEYWCDIKGIDPKDPEVLSGTALDLIDVMRGGR